MDFRRNNTRFALTLLGLFLLVWIALAIRPSYRHDWLLENAIVFLGVPVLVLTHRRLPLSRISYAMIFLFLCLHEVGAHYTYAEVPYDRWFAALSRDFAREWSESLRVKRKEPLGEYEIERLRARKG